MGKLRDSIKRAAKTISKGPTGRPIPDTPRAGYTSDGRRYSCGGKLRRKKN